MNIFVESVSVEQIRRAVAAGLADGVVVSDSMYAGSESVEGRELIEAVAQEFAIPICVEVRAISGDEMYREAKDLSRISEHLVIQLPLVEDAVEPMHRLSMEGVDICANFVFNGAQAVLAAKAGAQGFARRLLFTRRAPVKSIRTPPLPSGTAGRHDAFVPLHCPSR